MPRTAATAILANWLPVCAHRVLCVGPSDLEHLGVNRVAALTGWAIAWRPSRPGKTRIRLRMHQRTEKRNPYSLHRRHRRQVCRRLEAAWRNKKPLGLRLATQGANCKIPGNTYFRVCCTIIGSESLTTVFEMGTGVSFPIWSPGNTAAGRLKPAAANFVVGQMVCSLVLAYYSHYPRAFVTEAMRLL
jgi:hypothetical protein